MRKADKGMVFILFWRVLTLIDNVYEGIERFQKRIHFLLSFCNERFNPFFDELQKLLILYSINQTVLPLLNLKDLPFMHNTCSPHFQSLKQYATFFVGSISTQNFNISAIPDFCSWKTFALINFLMMHHINGKRTYKVLKIDETGKNKPQNLDDIQHRLYPFNVVNLTETKKRIKKLAHDVKDHKYLALFMGFLMEHYEDIHLLKSLLEESVAQPFDDKLIIKTFLCIIFYLEGDYFKCYQFIYQLLERERTQDKNTYVITYLASILCLKYLDKPEVMDRENEFVICIGSIGICKGKS
ncbi:MAG: hypothetical protein EOO43_17650 [Flavobacterium sp.]|nr:MAG: hypothetical protein EOO43_17650 [Flavobacterium sp.]